MTRNVYEVQVKRNIQQNERTLYHANIAQAGSGSKSDAGRKRN